MNNLTLGDEQFSYYETLGGGQGACPDADGPSAVHVAMSNTLNTPMEALEREFPLRVRNTRCAATRAARALPRRRRRDARDRSAARDGALTDHGAPPPRARRERRAGEPGTPGRNLVDGRELPGQDRPARCERAQRLRIETPGGGGLGHE